MDQLGTQTRSQDQREATKPPPLPAGRAGRSSLDSGANRAFLKLVLGLHLNYRHLVPGGRPG